VTWVRGAAIRPVPAYAVVPEAALDSVERELGRDEDEARSELDLAFHRFEETQPNLADKMGDVLAKPIDETALALGYFLSIAIWLAFERAFPKRLALVTEDAVRATEAALALEEELRASHSDEPLELDDVVAMEQPGVLSFVNEHLEAALDPLREVDVEDVHLVYRAILVLTLALSHAVAPEGGAQKKTDELLA
jgi:hypothetical protein